MFASSAALALAGGATRLTLVDVQTRLQITVFWALALAIALMSRGSSSNGRWMTAFFAHGAAATIAIVAARTSLEGLPRPLLHLVQHIYG
jgi:hypothetical protein